MPTTLTKRTEIWTGTRYIDLADPDPSDFHIHDICIGLARQRRYNGLGTVLPWSVGQHSILCLIWAEEDGIEDKSTLAGILMHDAPEYVLGDMVQPLKNVPGMREVYEPLERQMYSGMAARWNLPDPLPKETKHYDLLTWANEVRTFMRGVDNEWWEMNDFEEREIPEYLINATDNMVAQAFLHNFERVIGNDGLARLIH